VTAIVWRVQLGSQPHLTAIREAHHTSSRFLASSHGWQKKAGENGDDRDHDQ
jgi:hypothetical protein